MRDKEVTKTHLVHALVTMETGSGIPKHQRWARYSIIELIDIDTRYLKIELIDTEIDTRIADTSISIQYQEKKLIKKIGLQMNLKNCNKFAICGQLQNTKISRIVF